MDNHILDVNSKIRLEQDLKYIDNLLIAKQKNGRYCRYAIELHGLAYINQEFKTIQAYWATQYKKNKKFQTIILEALQNKFDYGLMSTEDMINLIQKSNDTAKEKEKAITLLTLNTEVIN